MVVWKNWREGITPENAVICGVDEAGRGPLAGPVVAAAVILPDNFDPLEINDSKLLTHETRERLFKHITETAVSWAVAESPPQLIDEINILQATFAAMRKAVSKLVPRPEFVFVDGNITIPKLTLQQRAIVKGDSIILPIACASILAKVTRDRIMLRLHKRFPHYGFDRHKGYPTPEHRRMIALHGPVEIHRRSFTLLEPQMSMELGDEQAETRHEV